MKEITFKWTTTHNYMMMAVPKHHIDKHDDLFLIQPDGTRIRAMVIKKTVNHLTKLDDFLMLAFFGVTVDELTKRLFELYPEMKDNDDLLWISFILVKKTAYD